MNRLVHIGVIAAINVVVAGFAAAQTPRAPAHAASVPSVRAQTPFRAVPVPPAVDAAFRAWDTDDDGALTLPEFRNGWRSLRRGHRQTIRPALMRQFHRLDVNHNGGIDRAEYPAMVLVKRAGAQAPAFSRIDSNDDQKLDFAEYSGVVRKLRALLAGKASQHH